MNSKPQPSFPPESHCQERKNKGFAGTLIQCASFLKGLWPHEQRCSGCLKVLHSPESTPALPFCDACLAELPRRQNGYCPLCGEPAPWANLAPHLCGRCLSRKPPWERFLFHGLYEKKLRELLLALKFKGAVQLGHSLGSLLALHPHTSTLNVDCVVPVPLHSSRLARRGYNQSHEIARPLAKALRLALLPDLLARVRATAPQSGTSLAERRRNIRLAFSASPQARGRHILLVDDTFTTGSTVEAAAESLLQAGAGSISVAVVSRTARLRAFSL